MKNLIIQFSRIFVGILFIISGLIKLNDPLGFSYKLEEYFSEPVFNMPFLAPLSLAIALFLVILEVVLGVMLLLGYKIKFTLWSLLLLIVMFSFLTFYSAYFDVVKDCGCFGDALKLTPWQSFTKDLILLFFILILFFNIKAIKPLFKNKVQNIVMYSSIIVCSFMGVWVLNHLPLIDFRPFQIGKNITQGMQIPDTAQKSLIEMVFIYKVGGVNTVFTENELGTIPEGAVFVERKDKIITQGYVPPIHDFTMEKDGTDYKEEFLQAPKAMLIVAYDLVNADKEGLAKMTKLYNQAKTKGYKIAGMTGSTPSQIAAIKKQFKLPFDFYFCDAITLKTIERANPSIVILNKGTILQKVHHNDLTDLKL